MVSRLQGTKPPRERRLRFPTVDTCTSTSPAFVWCQRCVRALSVHILRLPCRVANGSLPHFSHGTKQANQRTDSPFSGHRCAMAKIGRLRPWLCCAGFSEEGEQEKNNADEQQTTSNSCLSRSATPPQVSLSRLSLLWLAISILYHETSQ